MVKVLLSTIEAEDESFFRQTINNSLCKIFPGFEQYDQERKQLISLLGHLLCERVFLELKVPQRVLDTLHRNEFGKWQFQDASIHFNISHSHDKVIVVVSDTGPVGIDIEWIRPIHVPDYKDCFTPSEWNKILNTNSTEETFFNFWTKKESLLKAKGVGLQVPLSDVVIDDNIGTINNDSTLGYFTTIAIPGYCCNLCTTFRPAQLEVEIVKLSALLKPSDTSSSDY